MNKRKSKGFRIFVVYMFFVIFITGCGIYESDYKVQVKTDNAPKIEYSSKTVEGIFTRDIKSLSLQREQSGNINGFSIGFYGSINGQSDIDTYYSLYRKEDNGSYLLRKYPTDKTYINEITEGSPYVDELRQYVLIDKSSIDKLRNPVLFTKSFLIDGSHMGYSSGAKKYVNYSAQLTFSDVDKNSFNDIELEKMLIQFPELMDDNKVLLCSDSTSHILHVPEGTIVTEYNLEP